MRTVLRLKRWSIIMSALMLIIGLVVPASSWADIPDNTCLNNIPSISINPMDISLGGTNIAQDLSTPSTPVNPGQLKIELNPNATNQSDSTGNPKGNMTNQSTANQSTQGIAPVENPLSFENFNFNAKASQISDMSLLERMWRNARFYDTMDSAYEGMTAMPTWILPTEYTKSAITMHDWNEVNGVALNYTLPGTYLTPRWWDI